MKRTALIVLSATCSLLWPIGDSRTEVSVVRQSDGTAGTLTHLGEDIGIRADAHGETGPTSGPINSSTISGGPHGSAASGAVTTFGTPTPPNQLTPAPVLPMNPNRPMLPQQPSAPPSSVSPPAFGATGGGRFGR